MDMNRNLPHGELALGPGASHGLLVEKADLCKRMVIDFLDNDAVEMIAPIRRRGTG